MGKLFTLDSLREEVEKEFKPFEIEIDGKVLVLRNLLRVPRKNRDEVYALLDEMAEIQRAAEDEDAGALSSTEKSAQIALHIIPLVADDEALARVLVSNIEDDLALSLRLFNIWMEATQTGNSEDSSNS